MVNTYRRDFCSDSDKKHILNKIKKTKWNTNL